MQPIHYMIWSFSFSYNEEFDKNLQMLVSNSLNNKFWYTKIGDLLLAYKNIFIV